MSWSESLTPARMRRIALVARDEDLRGMLVRIADAGTVQLDDDSGPAGPEKVSGVALSATEPDLAALASARRTDLIAGENQLRAHRDAAVRRQGAAALAGWCSNDELGSLRARLADVPASVVPLDAPPGIDPPTLLGDTPRLRGAFAPLVGVFGVVPYRDIDPSIAAGLAYVAMFGMMFGDAGHGLLLLAAAAVLYSGRIRRLAGLRRLWVFVAGAGVTATAFGVLYGEFFGPTGVLPVLWLSPLADPVRLMVVAIAAGAVMLALAYGLGVVNRWREGGPRLALYSSSGIAGAATFLGLGVITAGVLVHTSAILAAGATVTAAGIVLSVIGMVAESGGGATGVVRSGVGVLDLVMHIGSNVISFARLAAFGMTHAALGWVIWNATVAAAHLHIAGTIMAAVVFVAGNAVAFALEALVAGVQALRLEFYELFTRIFVGAGQPFTPWRIPVIESEGTPC